ncbi:hypothetical protein CATMIT_01810, partial [Catenibacterium mitsuokai DSM 15897]
HRRAVALVGVEQGLVQLFARAQAGVDDGHVASRLLAGQADHLLGQQADRHRLAHVQGVDRLMGADRRGLQDQLAGFGDGHEEAGHFRVGHGDRAAGADLLAEQRHHAAGRVEHVAEAHGDEAGLALVGQGLAGHLGQTLGRAEHVDRVDRLVGGDQHEGADPGRAAGAGDGFGGQHVVAHRFAQLRFQQRHLLVGGGVEGGVGFGQLERVFDHRAVAAV